MSGGNFSSAIGPLAYWLFITGGLFIAIDGMNLHTGCSKAMEAWGWGKYTCNTLEEGMFFNQSVVDIAMRITLIVAAAMGTYDARGVEQNAVGWPQTLLKMVVVVVIITPGLTVYYWASKTINGHAMPGSIWGLVGFVVVTLAIPIFMELKGQWKSQNFVQRASSLGKWIYGIGGLLVLTNAGNLYLGCDAAMESWGWGKYSCDVLEKGLFFNQSMLAIAILLIMIIGASAEAGSKTLVPLFAPFIGACLAELYYWKSVVVKGHAMPVSFYIVQGVILGTYVIAVVLAKATSAREVKSIDKYQLLAA